MTSAIHEGKRLSPIRVTIAALLGAGLVAGSFFGYQSWASAQATVAQEPWFAGYVDVTATPTFQFEDPASVRGRDVMLSFIVADPTNPCTPSWGGHFTMDEAAASLDLDRRIARLQQRGGGAGVSFGGLLNDELASSCTDPAALATAYTSVIQRYSVSTVDLDIEGDNLTNTATGERRAAAIAAVQAARRSSGDSLAVWLTLPASTSGLTEDGTTAVAQMLAAGVDLAGVNIMTMNFGQSIDSGESMAAASERALTATHRQLSTLYKRTKTPLSDGTIWSKLGATPMIGQNDDATEVFGLQDATALNSWALKQGLGRMSMWSLNRDLTCGPNYVDLHRVSDSCSGIAQGNSLFADVLGAGFDGRSIAAASHVTTGEPVDPKTITDDPATSPYAIWSEDSSYLKGSKVVWHRNVYEAKWWTSGDLPDDPVLNAWETPWTLVGPVLAGEKPHELDTLAYDLYPEWVGATAYEKGTRVNFSGIPYQAKWWTQGDSPEAYSSNPDSSPWVPLTTDQVKAAEAQLSADQQQLTGMPGTAP